ncbi:MAG: hypothetical protein AB7C98_09075, partial [Acidithiobacillus sp.]
NKDNIPAFNQSFKLAGNLPETNRDTSTQQLLDFNRLVLIYIHLILKLLHSIQSTPSSAQQMPASSTQDTHHAS